MARLKRTPEPQTGPLLDHRRRHGVLRRVLLENVAFDSEDYKRHEARLAKARTPEARLAAYERTIAELGLTDEVEELLGLYTQPRRKAQRGGGRAA